MVVVRGEQSRKTYFDNRSLDLNEGYKIFVGGVRVFAFVVI